MTLRTPALALLVAAPIALSACGGGSAKTTDKPTGGKITASQLAALRLGTPESQVVARFGQPAKRFMQPITGAPSLSCAVYRSSTPKTFARLCYRGAKLAVASTAIGEAALRPTQPVKGGHSTQLQSSSSGGGAS